jgi:hypothetical protein
MTRGALSKNCLLGLVARRLQDVPEQVTLLAGELILEALHDSLAEGRPVSLRGFGSLIPRRYGGASKRLGLLFRPSPRLAAAVAAGFLPEGSCRAGGPASVGCRGREPGPGLGGDPGSCVPADSSSPRDPEPAHGRG